jgi:hypothetical protein
VTNDDTNMSAKELAGYLRKLSEAVQELPLFPILFVHVSNHLVNLTCSPGGTRGQSRVADSVGAFGMFEPRRVSEIALDPDVPFYLSELF